MFWSLLATFDEKSSEIQRSRFITAKLSFPLFLTGTKPEIPESSKIIDYYHLLGDTVDFSVPMGSHECIATRNAWLPAGINSRGR